MKLKIAVMVIAVTLIFSCLACAENERDTFSADNENICYTGRWSKDKNGAMCGSFEGEITVRFTGTSLQAEKSSGSVYVSVDGGEPKEANLSSKHIVKDLDDGEHTVKIYTSAQKCFPKISGFSVDKGKSLIKAEKNFTVEFIGDSILEGYIPGNNSILNTYGYLTAKHFGWDRNTVAFGGITLTAGYGSPDTKGMINRYFLKNEYNQDELDVEKWDTKLFTPDCVIINLGTNDYAPTDGEFTLAYVSFLNQLRASYPNAPIFVMKPFTKTKSQAIDSVFEISKTENVYMIDSADWNIELSDDNLHPNNTGHEHAAELLIKTLETYFDNDGNFIFSSASIENGTADETENTSDVSNDSSSDDSGLISMMSADSNGEAFLSAAKSSFLFPVLLGIILICALGIVIVVVFKKKKK